MKIIIIIAAVVTTLLVVVDTMIAVVMLNDGVMININQCHQNQQSSL